MRKSLTKKLLLATLGLTCSINCVVMGAAEEAVLSEKEDASTSAVYTLDPIIVTANRMQQKITETNSDVSVVNREQIENLHIENVEAALRHVPGIQFLDYGSNGINANLAGIRINGSKDIIVLVDGIRMSAGISEGHSGYFYAPLLSNMNNIERIEVLRGAAGTLYGSGGKGGVINIVTRKITNNSSEIDISRGQGGKEAYNFNTMGRTGKDSKLFYNLYYNKKISGNVTDGAGKVWEGHTDSKFAGIKIGYNFTDKNTLTLMYDKSDSTYSGTDTIYDNLYNGFYESRSFTAQHKIDFAKHWKNTFSFRKTKIKDSFGQAYFDPNAVPWSTGSDIDHTIITEQIEFHDKRNDLIFGLDYTKSFNNKLAYGINLNGDRKLVNHWQKNYSYFIHEDWHVTDKWTLSGGIRHDRPIADDYAPAFEPHTSKSYKISYKLTDKDTVYAGRSEFYMIPGLDKLYIPKYGNPHLLPSEGRTTSIGYTHVFNPSKLFTFNWFETKDKLSTGFKREDGIYQNFADGISRGWSAQYNAQINKHLNLNLGWSHLFYKNKGDTFGLGYYPKDKLTFDLTYTYKKFKAGLDGFYFIRRTNPENTDLKGWPHDKYGIYNLSLNYAPNRNMEVYLHIDNIFNTLWAEHTDVIWNYEPEAWYSMPGRVFNFGMKFKF